MLNKVTLMGRLTKDPMVKYSQGGTAIARYTLAIDRRPGKNGEQVTDFIDCIAFGSSGKFVEKYLRKGRKIVACGKLELNSYTKEDGTKVYALDVVMNEHYFADDKIPEEAHNNNNPQQPVNSLKDPNYDPIPMPNNNQAKTINGDDVVYLTNIQKFVDGHGATYISGTVAEPDLSDFEDDFHGNFSEFLTSCFKDRIDWYRISQNEELGKFPHGGVFGEKLELIV